MEGDKKEAAKVRFKELYAQCMAELKDPNLAAAEAMKRMQAEFAAGESTPTGASESVSWAANKRLETSKFKFKFPRARNLEIIGLVLGCMESSRRDLHNALLCTVLKSYFFQKNC